jgi:hypothetical protein
LTDNLVFRKTVAIRRGYREENERGTMERKKQLSLGLQTVSDGNERKCYESENKLNLLETKQRNIKSQERMKNVKKKNGI